MSGDGAGWIRALESLFKPRRLAAIWTVALLVFALPRSLWTALGVGAYFGQLRIWILGASLLALGFWIFEVFPGALGRWREDRRSGQRIRTTLGTLTPQENEWLRDTYLRGERTVALSAVSDVAQLLERRGLIVRIAPVMNSASYYFEVTDRVWKELGRRSRR